MSLPDLIKEHENYGTYRIIDVRTVNDGYGGYDTAYSLGAEFEGALVLNDSIQAQRAQQEGVTGVYTLTVEKAVRLPWHTIFCKADDTSAVYRVTSRDDNATPKSAMLDIREVHAEEYLLEKSVADG